MIESDILAWINNTLGEDLFQLGDTTVTIATLVSFVLIVVATFWISRLVRGAMRRLLLGRGVMPESSVASIITLIHYLILVVGLAIALQTMGFDLAALFAAGAIFAVGLGFAMQNIAQNFVAGVILLVERSIRPGDVLELEGRVVQVQNMGIRSTIVRTRDGEDLIVPNSTLVQTTVKNFTLQDSVYRMQTRVGVAYSSDLKKVRETLESVAAGIQGEYADLRPQVFLSEFGNSAVIYDVAVWMDDPWRGRIARSDLNEAIWSAFQEQKITIAFPQMDVHFDQDVRKGFALLASGKG